MKTFNEYIIETRQYLDSIPVEVLEDIFKTYFRDKVDPEDYRLDVYNAVSSWLPKNIDYATVFSIFMAYWYSKDGMGGVYSREGVEKFAKFIKSQPLSRIEKLLGAGSEGVVISIGDGKVMKILFDTDFMNSNKKTLAVMTNMIGKEFKTLPNIYKVSKNIIIRDDVTPYTTKCKDYYKIATSKFGDYPHSLKWLIIHGRLATAFEITGKNKKAKEVIKWLQSLKKELQSIGVIPANPYDLGDFALANIGETKDGRVVFFDW